MKKKRRNASTSTSPAVGGATTADPKTSPATSRAAFHEFVRARQAASAGTTARAKPAPPRPMRPTPERLEKADRPRKTDAGFYRAPAPIERLRDRKKLDPLPTVNEGMYQAGCKLYTHFYQGGLKGIAAQDLSRCVGGGDGGSCGFPQNDRAMFHRQKFREATRIMGWYETAPFRGAGRLVVDVVCFEMSISDAAQIHIPSSRLEVTIAAGMDRLREGLFALGAHWGLF